MQNFKYSAWFPIVAMGLLAVVTTAMYGFLSPNEAGIGNYEIAKIARISGWASGGVIAVLSLIGIGIINFIFRLVRLKALGPFLVLGAAMLWLAVAWNLTAEPRYTSLARAVIDFVARPLLWGSLVSTIFALICLLLPAKK